MLKTRMKVGVVLVLAIVFVFSAVISLNLLYRLGLFLWNARGGVIFNWQQKYCADEEIISYYAKRDLFVDLKEDFKIEQFKLEKRRFHTNNLYNSHDLTACIEVDRDRVDEIFKDRTPKRDKLGNDHVYVNPDWIFREIDGYHVTYGVYAHCERDMHIGSARGTHYVYVSKPIDNKVYIYMTIDHVGLTRMKQSFNNVAPMTEVWYYRNIMERDDV